MRRALILVAGLLLLAPAVPAEATILYPVFDAGNVDDWTMPTNTSWSYICQLGTWQAWFGFDVSGLSADTVASMTFTAKIYPQSAERDDSYTLWYGSDDTWITAMTNPWNLPGTALVGTLDEDNIGTPEWETIAINLGAFDLGSALANGYLTLMLTGPLDNSHFHGTVQMSESAEDPYLTVEVIPEPTTLWLLGAGLAGLARLRRNRRA